MITHSNPLPNSSPAADKLAEAGSPPAASAGDLIHKQVLSLSVGSKGPFYGTVLGRQPCQPELYIVRDDFTGEKYERYRHKLTLVSPLESQEAAEPAGPVPSTGSAGNSQGDA